MKLQLPIMRMWQHAPLAIVLFAAIVASSAYLQALDYPFIDDDGVYIITNTKLTGLHFTELWLLATKPFNPYEFLPLRDLSYWFDITLFGLTPSAFRVHNIILYVLCLPLVFATTMDIWRYFRPLENASAPWVAAAVTALFVVNPSHVEAVVWISARKDLLSTVFSLLALWFAMKTRQEYGLSKSYAIAALLALLAAMLSKATTIAVAPIIAMLWVFFWRDISIQNRKRTELLWPLSSLLLAACIALIFSSSSTIKTPAYFGVEVFTRALAVLGWLARLAVSPESRHFIYPVFDDSHLSIMVTLGVSIIVIALASVKVILHKKSLEGFALIAFVLICMPYTQMIPYFTNSLVADRFLTLAVWPAVLLIVSLSWRLKNGPRMILLLSILLLWGFQTLERPRDWRSHEALVDTDLRAYPGHYLPAYQKIIIYQLPKRRFREAAEIANNIIVPEARDVMINLVEVSKDLDDVSTSGNPRDAMIHLKNLEQLIKQPPAQVKWDPTMAYFWQQSLDSFMFGWQWLVKILPDDPTVRNGAKLSLVGVLTNRNAATRSQSLP